MRLLPASRPLPDLFRQVRPLPFQGLGAGDGDEVTVKRIRTGRGRVQFLPENPKYEIIEKSKAEVEILGKVTVALREVKPNHRGGYDGELVAMLRDPGIAELAAMIAELPDEMAEAVRKALKRIPYQKEKGEAMVLWGQRVLRRAGDELDNLME